MQWKIIRIYVHCFCKLWFSIPNTSQTLLTTRHHQFYRWRKSFKKDKKLITHSLLICWHLYFSFCCCIFFVFYLSLTFMVVVDVAGFQAMWLASRCSDLYMKRARPLLQVYQPTTWKVLKAVVWGAGLSTVLCNQFEMSPPPRGRNLSLSGCRDRRKWGKRDWVHTLQYPCAALTG